MKIFTHHSLELSHGMRCKDLLIVLSLHFILYAEIWWWHYYLWTVRWCVCWRSNESSSNAEKSFVHLWMFARFWKLKTQEKLMFKTQMYFKVVLKLVMMLKCQWHLCSTMQLYFNNRIEVSRDQMYLSCIFSTKITIFGAKRRTSS